MNSKSLVSIAVSAICCLPAFGAPAYSGESTQYELRIDRQPLSQALQQLATQSGVQIIFFSRVTDGLEAEALRGRFTTIEALERLLDGSQLTFRELSPKTIEIRPQAAVNLLGTSPDGRMPLATQFQQQEPAVSSSAASATRLAQADTSTVPEPVAEPVADQEVVVTGSRIARQDYNSNTPIVTVPTEGVIQNASSVTLETQLRKLPQFSGGTSSQFSTGFLGNGFATLNLRNLGDNRNLVLLDGRRMQPSSSSLAVDVNTLPAAIIENIEIISGGASAVYGADAVAGVINFKLKKDFEGAEFNVKASESGQSDYGNLNVSVVLGANSASGRGNGIIAADYTKRDPVMLIDRDWASQVLANGLTGGSFGFLHYGYLSPGANRPSQPAVDNYFAQFGAAPGAVLNGGTNTFAFNNDGSLFNTFGNSIYNYQGQLYPDDPRYTISNRQIKYNSNYNSYLSSPLERYAVFGRANYELGAGISAFFQANYTQYKVDGLGIPPAADNFWSVSVPRDANHPVPAALGALLDSRTTPGANWTLGRSLDVFGPTHVRHESDVYQLLAGLNGSLKSWTWEAYATHGETKILSSGVSGFPSWGFYNFLMQQPNYGAGFNSANYATNGAPALQRRGTCATGISPFIPQESISQDCLDFLETSYKNQTKLKQDVVEATIQGGLFDLPAGEVRVALGADYRRNTYQALPDEHYLPGPLGASDAIPVQGFFGTDGAQDVKEAYIEALLPLLKDKPFIQSLSIDLAFRYSDYSSSGGNSAYKADGYWQMVDSFAIRSGYQRAVRAPNVFELYSPAQTITGALQDPCATVYPNVPYSNTPSNPNRAQVQALCAALIPAPNFDDPDNFFGGNVANTAGVSIGNPLLEPEEADTFTFGMVFQPRWDLPAAMRISAALDYYDIKIDRAISFLSIEQTYQLCFNSNGTSNANYDPLNPFCTAIVRSPTNGQPQSVNSLYRNQAGIRTDGIDFQGEIGFDAGPGRLDFNVAVNYLLNFERAIAPGFPFLEFAGYESGGATGFFKWRSLTTSQYTWGPTVVGLRWTHLPSADHGSKVLNPASVTPGVGSYDLVDLFASYRLNEVLSFNAGIENLLDREPEFVNGIPGQTDAAVYDVIGRSFYLGVKARF